MQFIFTEMQLQGCLAIVIVNESLLSALWIILIYTHSRYLTGLALYYSRYVMIMLGTAKARKTHSPSVTLLYDRWKNVQSFLPPDSSIENRPCLDSVAQKYSIARQNKRLPKTQSNIFTTRSNRLWSFHISLFMITYNNIVNMISVNINIWCLI